MLRYLLTLALLVLGAGNALLDQTIGLGRLVGSDKVVVDPALRDVAWALTSSLQVGAAWLAIFPAYFLPVLLGGVTWAEVARLLLAMLVTAGRPSGR